MRAQPLGRDGRRIGSPKQADRRHRHSDAYDEHGVSEPFAIQDVLTCAAEDQQEYPTVQRRRLQAAALVAPACVVSSAEFGFANAFTIVRQLFGLARVKLDRFGGSSPPEDA